MSAKKKSNPPDDLLQELFDIPPKISQVDLIEFVNTRDHYLGARADLETLAMQLQEMLTLGCPVEEGQYTARTRADGRGVEVVECAPAPEPMDL
jgi:hypothetical protein